MNPEMLRKAVELAKKVKYTIIGTASTKMEPHIAAATQMTFIDDTHVAVSEWFCPGTVANLLENPFVSLVVWDNENDKGYQLIGKSEGMENMAMLGCWVPEEEGKAPLPQVERRVRIRVDRVTDFRHAPHNDVEENRA